MITLMRHGQPEVTLIKGPKKIKSSEMDAWIENYNASGVADLPPETEIISANKAHYILCSPLERARSSLNALGLNANQINSNLTEASLPVISIPFLKLSPGTWLIIFRLLWWLGLTKGVESKAKAKKRARQMAEELIRLAEEHENIFCMGHGFMNQLISSELGRLGWTRVDNTGSGYWSKMRYFSSASGE